VIPADLNPSVYTDKTTIERIVHQLLKQSLKQFIGIWQLEGWISQSHRKITSFTLYILSKNK